MNFSQYKNSWGLTPEDLVHSGYFQPNREALSTLSEVSIGPNQSHSVRDRVHDQRVLLVVATESTQSLHRALFESIDLIMGSGIPVTVVVFTDLIQSQTLRDFKWRFEHAFTERQYASVNSGNWLVMMETRLRSIIDYYAPNYILAPRDLDECVSQIFELCSMFNVPKAVVQASVAHLEENPQPADSITSLPRAIFSRGKLRGGYYELNFSGLEGVVVDVKLGPKNSPIVILDERDGIMLDELVASRSFTTVFIGNTQDLDQKLYLRLYAAVATGIVGSELKFLFGFSDELEEFVELKGDVVAVSGDPAIGWKMRAAPDISLRFGDAEELVSAMQKLFTADRIAASSARINF